MTNEDLAQFGVIGLGVMGANLALNVEDKGFSVAVYDRARSQTDGFMTKAAGRKARPAYDAGELVRSLARPRRILVMVPAGAPVDATIEGLVPHLAPGDVIIDGGNEYYTNTERRSADLTAKGIEFVGMGVSGGAEGARFGPSLMPGGQRDAYDKISEIMERIAAQVEDGPCVTYIGPGGAGHYVKMVHNGIEYGDMQLIAETYDLLKYVGGLSNDELADVFAEWNEGELESYLIEITSKIFPPRRPRRRRAVDRRDPRYGQDEGHRQLDCPGGRQACRPHPHHRKLRRCAGAQWNARPADHRFGYPDRPYAVGRGRRQKTTDRRCESGAVRRQNL